MKKLKYISAAILLASLSASAQNFSENFDDHNNRNGLAANCWLFFGTDVKTSSAISGSSTRSGQATSLTSKKEVRTPFLDIQAGSTLSFKHKISAYRNQDDRFLDVVLIDVNDVESAPILSHTYTSGGTVTETNITVGTTGVYRVAFQHFGTGGQGRGHIDDVVITNATYASDPGNNCLPVSSNPDSDGDGVADAQDEFPNDPTLAYTYSNTVGFGSLAFEDLWPFKGDYDFNDLVVDYKITRFINANNQVKYLEAKFLTTAVGGVLVDGLAINFPSLSRAEVANVTGQELNGYTSNSNGTENGQSNAVVVVFDDVEDVINRAGGTFYNTISGEPVGVSDMVTLTINFTSPVASSKVADADIFVFVGGDRGLEIHRADKAPTDLATSSVLGTGDDNSNAGSGTYYKTANNLPWVIETPVKFDYPTEKTDVLQAYLKFAAWAQSGGASFNDWYDDKSGYRTDSNIF